MNDRPVPDALKALDYETPPPSCISTIHKDESVPATICGALPCGHLGLLCATCKHRLQVIIAIMYDSPIVCATCHLEQKMGDVSFEEFSWPS